MSVNFLQKLFQSIHNPFQKTFVGEKLPSRLSEAIALNHALYLGKHPGYEACDCHYHDYRHIADVTECLSRLITQYTLHKPDNGVAITSSAFTCAIVAALFHDAGFIRRRNQQLENFFNNHEARGAEMIGELLPKEQWSQEDVLFIQDMIRGTHLPFFNDIIAQARERHDPLREFLVKALCTADYLGQMGQPDYIERLSLLYKDMEEACLANGMTHNGLPYRSLDELLNNTPHFWENVFQEVLQKECSSLYQYLAEPFPNGPNIYINTIRQHVENLRKRLKQHGS